MRPKTLLALTTCSPMIGAAIFKAGAPAGARESLQPRPHAQMIPQMVQRVCASCRVAPAELDAIALTIGPGSFTGLRVGVALVKALAFERRMPIAAVSSLDAIAHNAAETRHSICVMLDAKQQKVYAAHYEPCDGGLRRITPAWLGPPETWLPRLRSGRRAWLIVGDGISVYGPLIQRRFGSQAILAPPAWWYPRVVTVGALGLALLRQGQHTDAARLLPRYLYHNTCTVRPGSKSI